MEKIKLILCDIDNTLVPKHQDLSERAVQAIHQLKIWSRLRPVNQSAASA